MIMTSLFLNSGFSGKERKTKTVTRNKTRFLVWLFVIFGILTSLHGVFAYDPYLGTVTYSNNQICAYVYTDHTVKVGMTTIIKTNIINAKVYLDDSLVGTTYLLSLGGYGYETNDIPSENHYEIFYHVNGFYIGFSEGFENLVNGIDYLIENPGDALREIGDAITHPGETVNKILTPIKNDWNNGEYGKVAGKVVFEVALHLAIDLLIFLME